MKCVGQPEPRSLDFDDLPRFPLDRDHAAPTDLVTDPADVARSGRDPATRGPARRCARHGRACARAVRTQEAGHRNAASSHARRCFTRRRRRQTVVERPSLLVDADPLRQGRGQGCVPREGIRRLPEGCSSPSGAHQQRSSSEETGGRAGSTRWTLGPCPTHDLGQDGPGVKLRRARRYQPPAGYGRSVRDARNRSADVFTPGGSGTAVPIEYSLLPTGSASHVNRQGPGIDGAHSDGTASTK